MSRKPITAADIYLNAMREEERIRRAALRESVEPEAHRPRRWHLNGGGVSVRDGKRSCESSTTAPLTAGENPARLHPSRQTSRRQVTTLAFERRYSDDGGVEFAVRFDRTRREVELEHALEWLIDCLTYVRQTINGDAL